MQKEILGIVGNFDIWRGNSYTLAIEVAKFVKLKAIEAVAKDHPTAASVLEKLDC